MKKRDILDLTAGDSPSNRCLLRSFQKKSFRPYSVLKHSNIFNDSEFLVYDVGFVAVVVCLFCNAQIIYMEQDQIIFSL